MLMAVPGRHEDEDSPDVFLPVPVIPAEAHDMKNQIIKACHCSLAGVHGGAKATEFRVRARFYFPSISKLVRRFVARCDHCAGAKTVPTSTVGPKLPHLRGDDLKELHIDVQVFYGCESEGNSCSLAVYCPFSHYFRSFPLPRIDTVLIAETLYSESSRCRT